MHLFQGPKELHVEHPNIFNKKLNLEYIKAPWERVRQTNRDVYVKDLNGDGVIDDDDKTILERTLYRKIKQFDLDK